ncbi:MAG: glycosyltransferase [Bacteroidetes bacterium]|nr:glycosyltransferase [Bacteroidota bacterium]
MGTKNKKRVWFYRRLLSPSSGTNGGNLKVRDCYNHVLESDSFTPLVYFSPDTVWNDHPGNHWKDLKDQGVPEWDPQKEDLVFFSGTDWRAFSEAECQNPPVPVLNIAQPRHTRPDDPRYPYLKYPAIRIAKSENGANILKKFGVNGPVYVIPDGIDLGMLPPVPKEKDIDILIIGLKEPKLARKIIRRLRWRRAFRKSQFRTLPSNIEVQLPPKLPTRMDFLSLLARAKMAVCLPLQANRGSEGFYLPALEAMALNTLVVCPHAVGNVDHCLDRVNCLVPKYTVADILQKTLEMWNLPTEKKDYYRSNGRAKAQEHQIENERQALITLLDQAHDIWEQQSLFNRS